MMKNKHKTLLAIISVFILGILARPAIAQTPDIVTAEVDRNELTTDEYLTLKVVINRNYGTTSEPSLPPLDGFNLIGTSTNTSMSIINGVQSAEKEFLYTLHPTKPGELIIDPIIVILNGQSYFTNPIRVYVTQGIGQVPNQSSTPSLPSIPGFPNISGLLKSFGLDMPLASDNAVAQLDPAELPSELLDHEYLVVAEVDNPSPYLGEQITYTFRYYRPAASVGTQSYLSPDFTGFWVHPESEEKHYSSQLAGRNIRMTEIKTGLLPTVNGEIEIEPAQITSEGDLFSRSFTIQTQPEAIMVQPLPAGAPGSFTGAVGEFSITAEVDTNEIKINDAVTLNIIISGEGNLETFADPEWELGSQWRAFDSQAAADIHSEDGLLVGTRTINQVLVPTMAGNFTIPAIQFSFFDPQTETYQTTSTKPIGINVASDGPAVAPVAIQDNQISGGTVADIRPIKDTLESSSFPSKLTRNSGFWLLWTLPLFLLVGQYGWRKRKEYLMNNPQAKRNQKAAHKAYKSLKVVDTNSNDYYSTVGHILTTYLSDKLNRPVAGLTQAELSGLLLAHGVSNDLVEQVRTCLTISEMGQYAPTNQVNTNEVHLETRTLIAALEKVL